MRRGFSFASFLKLIQILHICANRGEPFDEVLVPAVDAVYVAQDRVAFGTEHGDEEDGGGAECGWADELIGLQCAWARDVDAVWVGEYGISTELIELSEIERALLVHPVVDERLSLSLRRDDCEEGEVVDVEPGVHRGVDFFMERRKLRWFRHDVDELRHSIVREVHL